MDIVYNKISTIISKKKKKQNKQTVKRETVNNKHAGKEKKEKKKETRRTESKGGDIRTTADNQKAVKRPVKPEFKADFLVLVPSFSWRFIQLF